MNENFKTFVVYIASLDLALVIDLAREAQIASLLTKKVKIPDEYLDFTNVFSEEKALVLSEGTKLNGYVIKLEDGLQPPYWPIYSLRPVELETLKSYIKTYLKTGIIWPSKSLVGAHILFDKKPDGSLCLYMDYRDLNNLMIENRYPLPLIGEL